VAAIGVPVVVFGKPLPVSSLNGSWIRAPLETNALGMDSHYDATDLVLHIDATTGKMGFEEPGGTSYVVPMTIKAKWFRKFHIVLSNEAMILNAKLRLRQRIVELECVRSTLKERVDDPQNDLVLGESKHMQGPWMPAIGR
jgi:hypothetical protein